MTFKYKAIIFDLDGVICNTDRYHFMAWKVIADELGIYFDESINERLKGVGRMESLEIILENSDKSFSKEEKIFYSEKKNGIYKNLLEKMTPLDVNEEVKDTLEEIKNSGIKTALGSSSKNAKLILEKIGYQDYFNVVCDGNSITSSKPNPEVYLKTADALGISPELCVVVEDAKAGILAAHAANMDCAAVGDGAKYHLAEYNLGKFSELLNII
ncbi:MAG: beta-phosphoglucomutase [Solirubrobacterales bacterium]